MSLTATQYDYLLIGLYVFVGIAFYVVGRIHGYRRGTSDKRQFQTKG